MLIQTPSISGYQIHKQLHEGSRTLVYRAIQESDSKFVVIKLLRREYPTFRELVQFCNQYTIARNLDINGIIKPYSLAPYRNGYILVMEDFGGISLADFIQTTSLSTNQFLTIAVQIADILRQIHNARVIHKDIKPGNILINPINLQVKLIDFSVSTLLQRENQEIQNPNVLEGTLAYISPEQTGRMNRGIDYRSDFYALGVTFYQLLTGQLPFESPEVMELIHCHIAKQPPQIQQFNPQIPIVLSDIVLKLMAKNAEDRYQSALGIHHDLMVCLEKLRSTGEIANFKIGQHDLSDRFLIPEKLYGREQEVQVLLEAFWRVSQGNTELMLVTGFSGIGKTAVVNEVHKPIVQKHGYFIKGKFDQLQRNIPFSAFVQAFQDLITQLLAESEKQLSQWKSKILQVLGEDGQVIIEVIPELEKLIGKQPPILELSGDATQNRFNRLLPKFAQVFTSESHPLVIFLDDLQWADSASLKLLQLLMNNPGNPGNLLILGAYRHNEVSLVHPLMLTVDEIRKSAATVNTIILQPLTLLDIRQLLADTLSCNPLIVQPLTELVYRKTRGNPFFTSQFLKALHADGFILFNQDVGYWQCDISRIKVESLTDDVVEFMAQQLQKLPLETQLVLKLAACIGAQFDLSTLAIVSEQSDIETGIALWKALQLGLIVPLNETYKFYQEDLSKTRSTAINNQMIGVPYRFLHDRVQQAAYYLIPEHQRSQVHYQVGQLLLQQSSPAAREKNIFAIANQLNYGIDLIIEQSEREQLIQLNLLAGYKARSAVAYQAARDYAQIGLNLLGESGWQSQYEVCLTLHKLAAEVVFLCGDFEGMNQLVEAVIHHTKTPLERIEVYIVKMQGLVARKQLSDVVHLGRSILKELGVDLPEQPTREDIQQALAEIPVLIGERTIEELFDLPRMRDAEKLAIMQVISSIASACYQSGSSLFPMLRALQVKLSIQYGNSPVSASGYVSYAMILNSTTQNFTASAPFWQLAYRLASTDEAKDTRALTFMVIGAFLLHNTSHLQETLSILQTGYQVGLETGSLEAAGYCATAFCTNAYWCGQPLVELEPQILAYHQQLLDLGNLTAASRISIFWEVTVFLLGNPNKIELCFEQDLQEEKSNTNLTWLLYFYTHRTMLKFLVGDINNCIADATEARKYLSAGKGLITEAGLYFYESLILLTMMSDDGAELSTQQQQVAENQAKLQLWAESAPMNYLHKWQLVEAEKSRVLGHKLAAIELYDASIAGAKEHGYIQEEALANELASKFYLSWGKEKVAAGYMQAAYYCYSHWGAKAKIIHLEQLYPHLLAPILLLPAASGLKLCETLVTLQSDTASNSNSSSLSDLLDMGSMLKIAQSFYSEIHLDDLVAQIMQVLVKTAGADKGSLILNNSGSLEVVVNYADFQIDKLDSRSLDSCTHLPVSIIHYVERIEKDVIASLDIPVIFASDPYLTKSSPQSLLCTPIVKQGQLIGILYLENTITADAFTTERLKLLKFLCTQAAISLENARLYQQSQRAFTELKQAQLQIVQSEKMSALGNLVAGVAHEINNPVGFLAGNIQPALDYTQSLFSLIDKLLDPNVDTTDIKAEIEEINLEYIREDFPKLIGSMREGASRIMDISNSLRTFSRADSDRPVAFNIHEGLDSTILILKHRLKANDGHPAISVVKNYGQLPMVDCYAGQLNQVFMNILSNAIDALETTNTDHSWEIRISTKVDSNGESIVISIYDNGIGMSDGVKAKIFDHLFTTKAVGKGTGLGLAIARQIIIEKHHGEITVNSTLGQGTEFVISLPIHSRESP